MVSAILENFDISPLSKLAQESVGTSRRMSDKVATNVRQS